VGVPHKHCRVRVGRGSGGSGGSRGRILTWHSLLGIPLVSNAGNLKMLIIPTIIKI